MLPQPVFSETKIRPKAMSRICPARILTDFKNYPDFPCQGKNFSLNIHSFDAEVAQSVEQGTENPRVGSSILSLGTSKIKGLRQKA
jgi:hypothetical protein